MAMETCFDPGHLVAVKARWEVEKGEKPAVLQDRNMYRLERKGEPPFAACAALDVAERVYSLLPQMQLTSTGHRNSVMKYSTALTAKTNSKMWKRMNRNTRMTMTNVSRKECVAVD